MDEFPTGDFPFEYSGRTQPLVRYLSERFPFSKDSGKRWEECVVRGQVQVFDHFVGVSYHVKNRDRVDFHPVVHEPEIDTRYRVIHEDSDILVIDKPANLPVHPTGSYRMNTLIHLLEKTYGRVHPVHRLDRETSGVMMLARNPQAARIIAENFHRSEKTYLVAVVGVFGGMRVVDMPLGPKKGSLIRIRQGFNPEGQSARTRFRLVAQRKYHSLLLARPETGRRHQIRAHLAEIGFPVVGDKIYGANEGHFLRFIESGWDEAMGKELGLDRQFLHCWKMRFRNPILKRDEVYKSALPEELCLTWKNLS